jgi:hypothetical protein
MRTNVVIGTLLVVCLAAGAAFFALKHNGRPPETARPAEGALPFSGISTAGDVVVAYYFHRTQRCPTCIKIEEYAEEAITTGFAEELRTGALVWRPVNIDEPGNEHFEEDYELSAQAVVLARYAGGEETGWKSLPRIWDLVGEHGAFIDYIQDEVRRFERGDS